MSTIEWQEEVGVSYSGNEKYGPLLGQIKAEQLASTRHRGMWAKLAEFENEGSARDASARLNGKWEEFEFVSRKLDTGITVVYARLRDEVTE
jgi:hypothetical protein